MNNYQLWNILGYGAFGCSAAGSPNGLALLTRSRITDVEIFSFVILECMTPASEPGGAHSGIQLKESPQIRSLRHLLIWSSERSRAAHPFEDDRRVNFRIVILEGVSGASAIQATHPARWKRAIS